MYADGWWNITMMIITAINWRKAKTGKSERIKVTMNPKKFSFIIKPRKEEEGARFKKELAITSPMTKKKQKSIKLKKSRDVRTRAIAHLQTDLCTRLLLLYLFLFYYFFFYNVAEKKKLFRFATDVESSEEATAKVGSNALMFRKTFIPCDPRDLFLFPFSFPDIPSNATWVCCCWMIGATTHIPTIFISLKKKKKNQLRRKEKEKKKRSKVTWVENRHQREGGSQRIYIYSSLSYDLSSPVADGGVFIRGIGSHALSPLRELPLSAVSRVSPRPPESPNMRRRKKNNSQQEDGKNIGEKAKKKKKSKEITADRSRGYTHHVLLPLYKYIQMYWNKSVLIRPWRLQTNGSPTRISLYLYFILVY